MKTRNFHALLKLSLVTTLLFSVQTAAFSLTTQQDGTLAPQEAVRVQTGNIEISVNTNNGAQVHAGGSSISVGTEANDGVALQSGSATIKVEGVEEVSLAPGITVSQGTEVYIHVSQEGAATAEKHVITREQVAAIQEGQNIDEAIGITTKEPLYYPNKKAALEQGIGYYLVEDGSVLMVVISDKEVSTAVISGTHGGAQVVGGASVAPESATGNTSPRKKNNLKVSSGSQKSNYTSIKVDEKGGAVIKGNGVVIEAPAN